MYQTQQLGENINAINGITKALPYTKEEMKMQPTGSLKSALTTAQFQLGRKKESRFNQTFIGFNVIHFYKKNFTQSHLCFYVVSLDSLVLYFGSFDDHVCQTGPYYHCDLVCGNVLYFCYAF